MTPLEELAGRLKAAIPEAQVTSEEPTTAGKVGFLDVSYERNWVAVEWRQDQGFGFATRNDHAYGEGPDEVYQDVEEAAQRITTLLLTGEKTKSPPENT